MEKTERYRQIIQQIIEQHASIPVSYGEVELQTIFDIQRDHYQLVHAGWNKNYRNYGCLMHMDIKEDKIWIQHDGTEIGVANELVALGIPKEDIVLAYMPAYKRPYAEYVGG